MPSVSRQRSRGPWSAEGAWWREWTRDAKREGIEGIEGDKGIAARVASARTVASAVRAIEANALIAALDGFGVMSSADVHPPPMPSSLIERCSTAHVAVGSR